MNFVSFNLFRGGACIFWRLMYNLTIREEGDNMKKYLIKNAKAIVTCDGADNVFRDGDILIEGNRIAAIGINLTDDEAEVIDAGKMFVYPGLINTHHHFLQAFTRNIPELGQAELFDWLLFLYELWSLVTEDHVYYSSMVGMGELVKYGCTTAFDHHFCFPRGAGKNLIDRQFEAADAIGIRYHAGRSCFTRGKSNGGLPPDVLVETCDETIQDCMRLIEKYHDSSAFAMHQVAVAPCSPFSVDTDVMVESAKLARDKHVRLHTHLAETMDEERYCLEVYKRRPLDWAADCGWLGSDVWYAHGIHFTDEELDVLAKTKTGVAHCPVSNMKTCAGIMKLPQMLQKGVPVGIAVDGYGAQDGSNLLDEIRMAYLWHRSNANNQGPAPSGYDCLKLATSGAAMLLGRDDIGSLEAGKAADLFMLDVEKLEYSGSLLDPASFPAVVGYHRPVAMTMINGKIVYKDGMLTGIDEEKIMAEANKIADGIYTSDNYKREKARMLAK